MLYGWISPFIFEGWISPLIYSYLKDEFHLSPLKGDIHPSHLKGEFHPSWLKSEFHFSHLKGEFHSSKFKHLPRSEIHPLIYVHEQVERWNSPLTAHITFFKYKSNFGTNHPPYLTVKVWVFIGDVHIHYLWLGLWSAKWNYISECSVSHITISLA